MWILSYLLPLHIFKPLFEAYLPASKYFNGEDQLKHLYLEMFLHEILAGVTTHCSSHAVNP